MNPHLKLATVSQSEISPAEWQARIGLAATYRLIAHYGWGDVIYNHSSMRVPGEERKFLIKRHEPLYTEVTPSNLVKVSMDDDLDESAGVNRPGFTLHGGVLSARPDVNCAVHVHTDVGMALAGLRHGLRIIAASGAFLQSRRLSRLRRHHRGFRRACPHQHGARQEPRADHAQSRLAHGGPDRARSLCLDEVAPRGGRHSAQNGSDRRRPDRNPGGDLRKDRAPVRASRFRPRLGRLARALAHARPPRCAGAELSAEAADQRRR